MTPPEQLHDKLIIFGGNVNYILGIDQGATNTRAAVMDSSGNILGYRVGAGSYFPRVGIKASMDVTMATVNGVLRDAAITADDLSVVVAGISGIDFDGDEIIVENALKGYFARQSIIACNDCEIAFYSGTKRFVGAVLCAGTGANAVFFAPNGRKFLVSDYFKMSLQGGTAISIRAIEAVFESKIGRWPETGLTDAFLDFSGDSSVYELLRRYMKDVSFTERIKFMTPRIMEIAQSGDIVAHYVIKSFSDELCACFNAVMNSMGMSDMFCDIVLAGGVLMSQSSILRDMIAENISRFAKNANIINAEYEPVVGACIMGIYKEFGGLDRQKSQRIRASADKRGLLLTSGASELLLV